MKFIFLTRCPVGPCPWSTTGAMLEVGGRGHVDPDSGSHAHDQGFLLGICRSFETLPVKEEGSPSSPWPLPWALTLSTSAVEISSERMRALAVSWSSYLMKYHSPHKTGFNFMIPYRNEWEKSIWSWQPNLLNNQICFIQKFSSF